jgi:hypothetical protein
MKTTFKYAALAASTLLWLAGPAPAADTAAKTDGAAQALALCLEQPLIAQLSGEWWQWAMSIPLNISPMMDPVGTNARIGQVAPVWYLGGSYTGTPDAPVVRSNSVPGDRALFFPLVNTIWWTTVGDPPWNKPYTNTSVNPPVVYKTYEQFYRAGAAAWINSATTSCTVDGKKVPGIRAKSPVFSICPDDSMADFFGSNMHGVQGPAIADGIYVLLPPLRAGQHTIRFTASAPNPPWPDFTLDVTYHLTVVALQGGLGTK